MRPRVLTAMTLCLAVVGASCVGESRRSTNQHPDVSVVRSGSTVTRDRVIGIAALVRLRGSRTLGTIRLRVSFRDQDGRVIDTTDDSLPYCPPRADCWWGATFPVDQFRRGNVIRDADVAAVDEAPPYRGSVRVLPFMVARQPDGRLTGRAPASEGSMYVIGFVRGQPRWGITRGLRPEDGRAVAFAPSDTPALAGSVRYRAFFYPGPVPRPGD